MRLLLLTVLLGFCTTGCVVKEEIKEGTRELRSGMKSLTLTIEDDGGAVLAFNWSYLLGIVDSESIAAIDWNYSLREPRGPTLARVDQRMREADESKTEILVVGDRARTLEIPPGTLDPDKTYILWFELYYRDLLLGELLYPVQVMPGEQVEEPFDPEESI
jgi:hypothetical protein